MKHFSSTTSTATRSFLRIPRLHGKSKDKASAGALAQAALNYARRESRMVVPLCSLVQEYIRRHPKEGELVEPKYRENYHLESHEVIDESAAIVKPRPNKGRRCIPRDLSEPLGRELIPAAIHERAAKLPISPAASLNQGGRSTLSGRRKTENDWHPDIATRQFTEIVTSATGPVDISKTYPTNNTTTFARGGHGLFSTATDYLRFAQMLINRGELDDERIISRAIADLMSPITCRRTLCPTASRSWPCPVTASVPARGC